MLRKIFFTAVIGILPCFSLMAKQSVMEDCPKTPLTDIVQTHLPSGHETIQFRLSSTGCKGEYEPLFVTCKWGEHHCRKIKNLQYRVQVLEDLVENLVHRNY